MSKETLAAIGVSLANIAGSITEAARQAGAGGQPPVHHFEGVLGDEVRRLHASGQPGIAGAIEGIRAPMVRLMTVGW